MLGEKYDVPPLRGWFPPVDSAELTLNNWLSGTYQNQQEDFTKNNLKIRPYAIRVNSQIHYDALGEIRRTIIEGKDEYLFETRYIHSLQGLDFVGTDKIQMQVEKLAKVSAHLKKENDVDVIVTIALDKAQFFKEKLPAQYNLENTDSTNYETYLEYFFQHNIHVLDFNKHFLQIKDSSEHALATKHGIHWSLYGGLTATDSIIGYIQKLKGKEVTRIDKSKILKTTEVRKEDDDIGQSINLYYPLVSDTFSYYEHYLFAEKKSYRPNVNLIGDSFCWTIWGQDIPHHYFGDQTKFLYYYHEIWDTQWSPLSGTKLNDEQKLKFAQEADVIILLYTPMNMNDFGSGFIDDMYELLFEEGGEKREERIE
ncbi:MAG: hypothetical protein AAF573_21140 [Bacteroidota bacterium]